jgi:preprotein translocase subunit SecD
MAKLTLRIWILIIVLVLALLMIKPNFESGVVIKSVDSNSSAFESGLRSGQIIKSINGQEIKNIQDYSKALEQFPTKEKTKLIITTKEKAYTLFTNETPQITVDKVPSTNLKFGLDIAGGSRALITTEEKLSSSELDDLIAVTTERLNVYGITDVIIRPTSDLSGNNYMLIEIAGATPSELENLIAKQGKFEAKIGNETVFVGGDKDIASVCRNDASCSGIQSCSAVQGGQACRFMFSISLSEEASKRQAEITSKLNVNTTEQGRYLDEKLDLYLDDVLVDSLLISEDLKGRATTQISIQGSGSGPTREEAFKDAELQMQKLQTVLITGSLPYKLKIVKLDTISPSLGSEFTRNILILGLVVFVAVSIVLFVKYRKIKITASVILTMFSEAFITLGIAALINWNLDAPSIAGIIAGMGTGVNDQIVIIDEAVSTESSSIKERIKRALFIIVGAFFTIIAAMLPLFWAGAGLLRGFALTTIISVSVGILITRPAFADILKKIHQ